MLNSVRKYICLSIILIFAFYSYSQTNVIDSLKNELLKHSKKDTVRAELLIHLVSEMTYSNPKEAFPLIDESIKISKSKKWIEGEILGLRQKGNLYYVLADNLNALDSYQNALVLSENITDRQLKSSLLSNIGNIYADLKAYDKALENYYEYLKTAQTFGSRSDEIKALSNIGIIYNDSKNYEKGISNLEKALRLAKLENNNLFMAAITNNLALAQKNVGKYEMALDNYHKAIDLAHLINNKYIEASSLNSIGKINSLLNQNSQAKEYANRALSISKEIGAVEWEADSWSVLSNTYEKQGDMNRALSAYKKYILLRDSVLSEEKKSELTRKEMQYKMEHQLAISEEEIKRERLVKNTYLIGSIFLLFFGALGYFFYKRRRDALEKKKIAEFNAQVAETELKALRSQMNPHFIFNSLNSISDFISKKDIKQANDYLIKFSKLTRSILENSEKKRITLKEDLKLMELYIELETLRLEKELKFSISVHESIDIDNTLIPPLILQPFIENSIWHGVAPKKGIGQIDIDIKPDKNILVCYVDDNGVGSSKSLNQTIKEKSFGVKITSNRIDIINHLKNTEGSLKFIDKNEGVRVEIRLPFESKF